MAGIQMLDIAALPAGARRDLAEAIYGLYERAGRPATREVAEAIRSDDSLPGTLSHEGVAAMIRGSSRYANWANLESLVRTLASRDIARPDLESAVSRIRELWLLAARQAPSGIVAKDAIDAASPSAASRRRGWSVFDHLVFADAAQINAFAAAAVGLGAVLACFSGTNIDAVIARCDALGLDVAAEIIEYGSELPVSQIIAECSVERQFDEADAYMIISAVYRPLSEVTEAMLRPGLGEKGLMVSLMILGLFVWARPLTDLTKLYAELWVLGDADRAEGALRLCGAVRELCDLVDLLGMLRDLDADDAARAVCIGASHRPPRDVVQFTALLRERGRPGDAEDVLWEAAWDWSADDVVALLAALRDAERSLDADHLVSSIAWRDAKGIVEVIAVLRRDARDAAAEQLLRSVAAGETRKIAKVLVALNRLSRHPDMTYLLTEVRTQRASMAAALAVILDVAGLKEHAQLLAHVAEPTSITGSQP